MECGATCYESLALVNRYQRRTTSLNEQALVYASETSFTMAAHMCGISPSSLMRLFDKREVPQRRILPKVIAINEWFEMVEKSHLTEFDSVKNI